MEGKNNLNNSAIGMLTSNNKLFGAIKSFSALFLLCAFFTIISDNFLTFNNLITVAHQTSHIAILALAETCIIITGGIDLSLGSILAVAGVVTGKSLLAGVPIPFAVLLGILTGGICGLFNGFVVARMKLVPFIATLGMQNIARGVAYVTTNSLPVSGLPKSFYFIGGGTVGKIPVPVIIIAVLALFFHFLLKKTAFGRRVYAIGSNSEAARLSGINIEKTQMGVFTVSGLLAGVVGVILASRVVSAQPNAGIGYEADAIAAAIIGGTSPSGGSGNILGTIIGSLIIGVLKNGLNLMQINAFWQQIAIGCVIIVAVYVDRMRKQSA